MCQATQVAEKKENLKKKKSQDLYEPRHSFTVSVPLLDFEVINKRLNAIFCFSAHFIAQIHTSIFGPTQLLLLLQDTLDALHVVLVWFRSILLTTGVVGVLLIHVLFKQPIQQRISVLFYKQ